MLSAKGSSMIDPSETVKPVGLYGAEYQPYDGPIDGWTFCAAVWNMVELSEERDAALLASLGEAGIGLSDEQALQVKSLVRERERDYRGVVLDAAQRLGIDTRDRHLAEQGVASDLTGKFFRRINEGEYDG
jgi:hypothetical protein